MKVLQHCSTGVDTFVEKCRKDIFWSQIEIRNYFLDLKGEKFQNKQSGGSYENKIFTVGDLLPMGHHAISGPVVVIKYNDDVTFHVGAEVFIHDVRTGIRIPLGRR
jgi:hypothetical protein